MGGGLLIRPTDAREGAGDPCHIGVTAPGVRLTRPRASPGRRPRLVHGAAVHLYIGNGDSPLGFGIALVHREHEGRVAERDKNSRATEAALVIARAEVTHERIESGSKVEVESDAAVVHTLRDLIHRLAGDRGSVLHPNESFVKRAVRERRHDALRFAHARGMTPAEAAAMPRCIAPAMQWCRPPVRRRQHSHLRIAVIVEPALRPEDSNIVKSSWPSAQ